MSSRIPPVSPTNAQLPNIAGKTLESGLKHSFFTGWSSATNFFWNHRYVALPLAAAGVVLLTVYLFRKYFSESAPSSDESTTASTLRPPIPYNPKNPAPIAQAYSEVPHFKIVEDQAVLQLQNAVQNTNSKHISLQLAKVQSEGLLPTQMLQVDNATYYCSSPFILGNGKGRITVLGLCFVDGKAYPRLFYFSQSQGLWRVLPQIVKVDPSNYHMVIGAPVIVSNNNENRLLGHFGKGLSESDTILPNELTIALSSAYLNQKTTFPKLEDKAHIPNIVDTAPFGGVAGAFYPPEYTALFQELESVVPDISGTALNFTELSPEYSPDFSRPLSQYDFWSPLYGSMRGYIYPSQNNTHRFLFCEVIEPSSSAILEKIDRFSVSKNFDSIQGKAFLAAIEVVHENPVTIFGNREYYAQVDNIDLPLLEYPKQIPGSFAAIRGSPYLDDYCCAWNVIRENPLVQKWYQSQSRDLPPAYTNE